MAAVMLLAIEACSSTAQPSQLRMSVAERGADRSLSLACAQRCEEQHTPGSGALFECVRQCPGVEASYDESCAPAACSLCYGKPDQARALDATDRDNAARLAIGMLRGLDEVAPLVGPNTRTRR